MKTVQEIEQRKAEIESVIEHNKTNPNMTRTQLEHSGRVITQALHWLHALEWVLRDWE